MGNVPQRLLTPLYSLVFIIICVKMDCDTHGQQVDRELVKKVIVLNAIANKMCCDCLYRPTERWASDIGLCLCLTL